jgi:hypothetical protein
MAVETHDWGRLYWYVQRYPRVPRNERTVRMPLITESALAYEVEAPFRTGRGRSFRLWPTRWALLVGLWSREGAEDQVDRLREELEMVTRDMKAEAEELRDWRAPAQPELPDGVTIIHWPQEAS